MATSLNYVNDEEKLYLGNKLTVTVDNFSENAIIVTGYVGARKYKGALLGSEFDDERPMVSKNVFNWDYSKKTTFPNTAIFFKNTYTTDTSIMPSKLLTQSNYLCANCKKKMSNNHRTEHRTPNIYTPRSITHKSDIIMLKQTLSYPELIVSTVKTSSNSTDKNQTNSSSPKIGSRKLKRKKSCDSKSADISKRSRTASQKEEIISRKCSKNEKLENKLSKEAAAPKQNNEVRSKSIIKCESVISNGALSGHENNRVMPQTLARLNNISSLESNQEMEEFFNRECPKPKKIWMKMIEDEDSHKSFESVEKELPFESLISDYTLESAIKDCSLDYDLKDLSLDSIIKDSSLQSIFSDSTLESVIRDSLKSISKYATFESMDKDSPKYNLHGSDLAFDSVIQDCPRDHTSKVPILELTYQDNPIEFANEVLTSEYINTVALFEPHSTDSGLQLVEAVCSLGETQLESNKSRSEDLTSQTELLPLESSDKVSSQELQSKELTSEGGTKTSSFELQNIDQPSELNNKTSFLECQNEDFHLEGSDKAFSLELRSEDLQLEMNEKACSLELQSEYVSLESNETSSSLELQVADLSLEFAATTQSLEFPIRDLSSQEALDLGMPDKPASPSNKESLLDSADSTIAQSKFSCFSRSYKIKQSLHDRVILTVDRGSLGQEASKDVYSFTDEDDTSTPVPAPSPHKDGPVAAPQTDREAEPNEADSVKSLQSNSSRKSKLVRRSTAKRVKKSVFEQQQRLESQAGAKEGGVAAVSSCENSAGLGFKLEDVVWAKITGYPFWPARIVSLSREQEAVVACIEWYAWKEVSFIKVNNLFHFKECYPSKYQSKKRSSKYQEAVKLARASCGMLEAAGSDDQRTLCSTRGSGTESESNEGSATSAS